MKHDIILAGVGGQGILTIAYLIDNAALREGYYFKQAEVHGMAQRGGAVQSHLRISKQPVASDLVPLGGCDLVLAVEPLEALRYLTYLKPDGVVVSSSKPFINIPNYPDQGEVLRAVSRTGRHVLLDAGALAAAAGSRRSENVVMVGAASPFLPFQEASYKHFVRELFGRKGEEVVQANFRAFDLGKRAGEEYARLVEGGADPQAALARISSAETIQRLVA